MPGLIGVGTGIKEGALNGMARTTDLETQGRNMQKQAEADQNQMVASSAATVAVIAAMVISRFI